MRRKLGKIESVSRSQCRFDLEQKKEGSLRESISDNVVWRGFSKVISKSFKPKSAIYIYPINVPALVSLLLSHWLGRVCGTCSLCTMCGWISGLSI